MLLEALMVRALRSPKVARTGLELARARRPILSLGRNVIVTSADAIDEVLARPREFVTATVYEPKVKFGSGPSLLGMDPSPAYDHERKLLMRVLGASALERWRRLLDSEAGQAEAALDAHRIDVLNDYVEPVLVRSFAELYGLNLSAAKSALFGPIPGELVLAHWMRKVGGLIAMGSPAPFGFEEIASTAAGELFGFLERQAQSQQSTRRYRGAIGALLETGDPKLSQPSEIARCIGTMLLAGTTTVKAAMLALHELLTQPDEIRYPALAAARAGDQATLLLYALEALRFRPVFPLLARYCPVETTLSAGSALETPIAAGSSITLCLMAAMFDPARVERPDDFVPGRPASVYLHFGHETHHACFGRHLAAAALQIVLSHALPALDDARPGRLKYDGVALSDYILERTGDKHVSAPSHLGRHTDSRRGDSIHASGR